MLHPARGGRTRAAACALGVMASLVQVACSGPSDSVPTDAITVGAVLPFTGDESAIGANLEQALILATEDVNRAGGVDGRPLRLLTRDSNSGSARGLDEALELLYVDQVGYLIGPEEDDLANEIAPDIKGLDTFNVLPGYSAPPVERVVGTGAWLRLAPSPAAIGCALARQLRDDAVETANALVEFGDYNSTLAAEFNAQFARAGGRVVPSVTVGTSRDSYVEDVREAFEYDADRTLLIAAPASAATIVTEWAIGGRGAWHLSPALHADGFLLNVPYGALDGFQGLSPSLSLADECEIPDSEYRGEVACTRTNASAFADHYAARWDGDRPFPAAHFYYDAIVLLALGLNYGVAERGQLPSPRELRGAVRELSAAPDATADWRDLDSALSLVRGGSPARYRGAAAEYEFDRYGAAQHTIFDTWRISQHHFVDSGSLVAWCPRNL